MVPARNRTGRNLEKRDPRGCPRPNPGIPPRDVILGNRDRSLGLAVWRRGNTESTFLERERVFSKLDPDNMTSVTFYENKPVYAIPRVHFGRLAMLLLDGPGRICIHGAMVRSPHHAGLLIPGSSGGGKTSLCIYLMECGCYLLSDEMVWLNLGSLKCLGYPRRLGLTEDCIATWFPRLAAVPHSQYISIYHGKRKLLLDPEDLWPGRIEMESDLTYILKPSFWDSGGADIRRMTKREVVESLASNCSRPMDVSGQRLKNVQGYRILLGTDSSRNTRCVGDFLDACLGPQSDANLSHRT